MPDLCLTFSRVRVQFNGEKLDEIAVRRGGTPLLPSRTGTIGRGSQQAADEGRGRKRGRKRQRKRPAK